MKRHNKLLAVTGREIPGSEPFENLSLFLRDAGTNSLKTERTYRAGLRTFADWLQHTGQDGYTLEQDWPLSPTLLSTTAVLSFRSWLLANKSVSTVRTYIASVLGYLYFLDGIDQLPTGIRMGKLVSQLKRRTVDRNQAATVIDLDKARQDGIPDIIAYFDKRPLPLQNDRYNRRLSLLRDRVLVHVLYSTAARLSEVLALDRTRVGNGRSDTATVTGKGNKSRTLHLLPNAQQAIRAYLAERTDSNPALLVSHSHNSCGVRLSESGARLVLKTVVSAQKLHPSLSAHDFRHYRATQLLRESVPLEVVQEYLGHADVSTTRSVYAPVLGVKMVREWLDMAAVEDGVISR
jgi:integrase/recombinase XerD